MFRSFKSPNCYPVPFCLGWEFGSEGETLSSKPKALSSEAETKDSILLLIDFTTMVDILADKRYNIFYKTKKVFSLLRVCLCMLSLLSMALLEPMPQPNLFDRLWYTQPQVLALLLSMIIVLVRFLLL